MKHLNIISKSFGLGEKKIKAEDKVENFNWDSMTVINLIGILDDKFSKSLDLKKLKKIVYFKDIDELIEKTIKKK
jgi:acyl carrier protein